MLKLSCFFLALAGVILCFITESWMPLLYVFAAVLTYSLQSIGFDMADSLISISRNNSSPSERKDNSSPQDDLNQAKQVQGSSDKVRGSLDKILWGDD